MGRAAVSSGLPDEGAGGLASDYEPAPVARLDQSPELPVDAERALVGVSRIGDTPIRMPEVEQRLAVADVGRLDLADQDRVITALVHMADSAFDVANGAVE